MTQRETLRREFDAADGSFIARARCELVWDGNAFRKLTSAMYDVADEARNQDTVETWIAHGFWFCDTWIREWTDQPGFPRPDRKIYDDAIQLIHDLSYFLFVGESPYEGDILEQRARRRDGTDLG